MDLAGKKLFIGADEAGYGPNLGPLLIGCSAWLAPEDFTEQQFMDALSNSFQCKNWSENCEHIPLGDSKQLYKPGGGLLSLEMSVLCMLNALNRSPSNLSDLVKLVSDDFTGEEKERLPWYAELDALEVPEEPERRSEVQRLTDLARESLEPQGIELVDLRATVITEVQFNFRVDELGSKGQLLSQATLRLVSETMQPFSDIPAVIFCDRQGGRKNYFPVLMDAFPDEWFMEIAASNERCSYRSSSTPINEIHFSVGGDAFPPTALASMLAKYLRERLMGSFNQFWAQHTPELRPTAGYPVDALRFRDAIEPAALNLGLNEENWWRSR